MTPTAAELRAGVIAAFNASASATCDESGRRVFLAALSEYENRLLNLDTVESVLAARSREGRR